MNNPMVQYMRQALKHDASVIQELDRILGSSSTEIAISGRKKDRENILHLGKLKGIYLEF